MAYSPLCQVCIVPVKFKNENKNNKIALMLSDLDSQFHLDYHLT